MEIRNFLESFILDDLLKKENLVSTEDGYIFKKDGHELVIKSDDSSIVMSYSCNPFIDYCNSLDDDIFVKACERYSQEVGPIKDLDSYPTIENQTKFKDIVRKIVKTEILRLEKYL